MLLLSTKVSTCLSSSLCSGNKSRDVWLEYRSGLEVQNVLDFTLIEGEKLVFPCLKRKTDFMLQYFTWIIAPYCTNSISIFIHHIASLLFNILPIHGSTFTRIHLNRCLVRILIRPECSNVSDWLIQPGLVGSVTSNCFNHVPNV